MVGHYYSRGSLHSLVGREQKYSQEDETWIKKVLEMCMGPQDAMYASGDCYYLDENGYYYEDEILNNEVAEISILWGTYKRPDPIFNDKYFSPIGR